MTSDNYTPSVLVANAKKSTVKEFINLINHVINHLNNESGKFRSLAINGKLVQFEPIGEAIIVGDLHGDLKSLIYILKETNFLSKVKNNENIKLIFLGDYGDRGLYSFEVYYVVLKLKQIFPEQIILIRGNHEGPPDLLALPHELPVHLKNKFGRGGSEAYLKLQQLFQHLYTCVIIKNKYILLHGGFPSQAKSIIDFEYAHEKHPKEPHLEEILWNDPWTGLKGTISSPRGAGRLFGKNITNKFLKMLEVKALIRGHQSSPNGYKINHNGKVFTIFSRKGQPYNNKYGAYLHMDFSIKKENARKLQDSIQKF
jgi:protein phosphatase